MQVNPGCLCMHAARGCPTWLWLCDPSSGHAAHPVETASLTAHACMRVRVCRQQRLARPLPPAPPTQVCVCGSGRNTRQRLRRPHGIMHDIMHGDACHEHRAGSHTRPVRACLVHRRASALPRPIASARASSCPPLPACGHASPPPHTHTHVSPHMTT